MAQAPFQTTRVLDTRSMSITPLGSFTLTGGVVGDFRTLQLQGVLGKIVDAQSIWVDASQASHAVRVLNQKTRQYVVFPPGSAGWQPMIIGTDATELQFLSEETCTIGAAISSYPFVTSLSNTGDVNSTLASRRVDITASAADQQFLAANQYRAGFTVFNDSTNTLYLLLNDGVSSATNFTVKMAAGDYFETPFNYGGEVRGIWNGTNGGARITEFE